MGYVFRFPRLLGFFFLTKKKASFSIEDMREVSNMADVESFKRLVLPQGHKAMLESLVRSHFRQREGKMHRRKQSNTIRGEGTSGIVEGVLEQLLIYRRPRVECLAPRRTWHWENLDCRFVDTQKCAKNQG